MVTIVGPGLLEDRKGTGIASYLRRVGSDPSQFTIVSQPQPSNVLLVLGDATLQSLTGQTDAKRRLHYLRGYPLDTSYGLVIPSYSPAELRKGQSHLIGVLAHDIRMAIRLEAEGFQRKAVRYQTTPSIDEAKSFLFRCAENQGATIAYDIETPYSKALAEDDQEEDTSYEILTMQFSLAPQEGINFPWQDGYKEIAAAILSLPNMKAGHNVYRYDNPRIAQAGIPIKGTIHDTLWLFHHLQPDLPAHLQYVASFYGADAPWKHLADSDPGHYGCADVDMVQRIMAQALRDLDAGGIARGYQQHICNLEPILTATTRRGIPVNDTARLQFKAQLEARKAELGAEIEALVPAELLNVQPKEGYVREPKVLEGLVERYFDLQICCKCVDTLGKPATPCDLCGGTGNIPTTLTRWCKLLPFSPNSGKQLIRYMKHRGHTVPRSLKKDDSGQNELKETTAKLELVRLGRVTRDPIYAKIVEWRETDKMGGTFVEGWTPDAAGRVHGTFYYETGTGQLSSRNPNVQNAPKHGLLAKSFRNIIQASPGHHLVEFDYRSAHALTLGFEAQDKDYMRMARLDIHSMLSGHVLKLHDVGKLLEKGDDELGEYFDWYKSDPTRKAHRDKKAKPTILGYGFGLGPKKLYDMNRESIESQVEARRLIDMLNAIVPKTAAFRDSIRRKAHQQGYLRSLHGYVRWFFDVYRNRWNDRDDAWEQVPGFDSEAAIAFLPANDAFGTIKDAMLELDHQGWLASAKFINTVHDSFDFEMPDNVFDDAVPAIYQAMTTASTVLINPSAPEGLQFDVEVKVGKTGSTLSPLQMNIPRRQPISTLDITSPVVVGSGA